MKAVIYVRYCYVCKLHFRTESRSRGKRVCPLCKVERGVYKKHCPYKKKDFKGCRLDLFMKN